MTAERCCWADGHHAGATAADAAGYARCAGREVRELQARGSPGLFGRAGVASPTLSSRRLDGLREVDSVHDRSRLKGVVGERLDDAGAGDGHDPGRRPRGPEIGDDHRLTAAALLQQRREAHADERRQVAAASSLRRLVDCAILVREASRTSRARADFELRLHLLVGFDGALAVAGR